MSRNEQQGGIEEGIVSSTTTVSRSQADEDELRSSTTATSASTASILPQHYVLRQERNVQSQPSVKKDDTDNMVQVGAFSESFLSNTTEARTVTTTQDSTAYLALYALVVDEEISPLLLGPIVESKPMEKEYHSTDAQYLNTLLQSRKCRIISALAITLVVGLIVAVVILTKNGAKSDKATPGGIFLAELKPLLSNESLTALDDPDSPQSQSLRWLLERSNFQAWPFYRLVQRFAMATIYFATSGPSWSNAGGNNWLTNETECAWFQGGSPGDFCSENGTLHTLNQNKNELHGTIPDEIGLLSFSHRRRSEFESTHGDCAVANWFLDGHDRVSPDFQFFQRDCAVATWFLDRIDLLVP